MKNLTNKLTVLLILGFVAVSALCCNSVNADNSANLERELNKNQKTSETVAYYFHGTSRCVTCEAVETVTRDALKELYGDKVAFVVINREEEKDNPLVVKHQISGQTLLIINGDKKVDLTTDAFLNARTNPDKFKSKLKATIDSMN